MALRLMSRVQSVLCPVTPFQDAFPPLAPEVPCYVIGDIHGRLDLLDDLLDQINEHVGAMRLTNPHLVFVGDYIDRGPDSAEVLERLQSISKMLPDHVHCLLGNHERMMLDFLTYPTFAGPLWMRNGGLQTLDSFGITGVDPKAGAQHMKEVAGLLAEGLNDQRYETLDWLQSLHLSWRTGNLFVSHAGADPRSPLENQSPNALIWGHAHYRERLRRDGNWVACSDGICDAVTMDRGRIAVDTGGCENGRLSAFAVRPGGDPVVIQT